MSSKPSARMITALFTDLHQAIEAYDWLRTHGFAIDDISVLMSDKTAPLFHAIEGEDKIEQKTLSAPGAEASGAVGAAIGGGITGAVAVGATLLLGGPLGLALIASLPGAMIGGLLGGLVGFGFPEKSAKAYEEAIRHGGIAIGVTPRNAEECHLLENKFHELHGDNILKV